MAKGMDYPIFVYGGGSGGQDPLLAGTAIMKCPKCYQGHVIRCLGGRGMPDGSVVRIDNLVCSECGTEFTMVEKEKLEG